MQRSNFKRIMAVVMSLPVLPLFADSATDDAPSAVMPAPVYVALQTTGAVQRLAGPDGGAT